MKLRLRSVQSKETIKLEVPNSSSLYQLKQYLSQALSSTLPASSLHLSLNRKDELLASSLDDSLPALGVASGDLIYFSLYPADFSSTPHTQGEGEGSSSENPRSQGGDLQEPMSERQEKDVNLKGAVLEKPAISEGKYVDFGLDSSNQKTPVGVSVIGQSDDIMDVEEPLEGTMNVDDSALSAVGDRFSEPFFLRRVLRKELGDNSCNCRRLVISIHAVLLESGFVGFNSVSGVQVDRLHLPDEWPSMASTMTLRYTLPEILNDKEIVTEHIVLKFQRLGCFINVYGSLGKGGEGLYHVCLDENRFAKTIDLLWANWDKSDRVNAKDGSPHLCSESEVFAFWKIVKDGLALPLLIDICQKTGLSLPPCLMRLPAELKLKILESLRGVDVARMGCVCSEMRYLSSSNDLWKRKFMEEFGNMVQEQGIANWKTRFAVEWDTKKRLREEVRMHHHHRPQSFYPFRMDPRPFGFPSPIIGGDYDRLPGLGLPSPFGQHGLPSFGQHGRRRFSPHHFNQFNPGGPNI